MSRGKHVGVLHQIELRWSCMDDVSLCFIAAEWVSCIQPVFFPSLSLEQDGVNTVRSQSMVSGRAFVEMKPLKLCPRLMPLKLRRGPAVWAVTSPLGNSDAPSSLKTLSYFSRTWERSCPLLPNKRRVPAQRHWHCCSGCAAG